MRLWTVHPRYLDAQGLVAAWREGLLARKVLAGKTKGYKHHPQLIRFQAAARPQAAIEAYLAGLADEADARGYRFDRTKLARRRPRARLVETRGQLALEWRHLRAKLRRRAPAVYARWRAVARPAPHPLFALSAGPARAWEKAPRRGV